MLHEGTVYKPSVVCSKGAEGPSLTKCHLTGCEGSEGRVQRPQHRTPPPGPQRYSSEPRGEINFLFRYLH